MAGVGAAEPPVAAPVATETSADVSPEFQKKTSNMLEQKSKDQMAKYKNKGKKQTMIWWFGMRVLPWPTPRRR